MGANLDTVPTKIEVNGFIAKRNREECHLLFVGVDWKRKGADIVLETAKILHERGMNVVLHLCGLRQIPVELPPFVVNHGFLRKTELEEFNTLLSLYKTSHFLFVPSVAEAYGLVFCEASAYGLPSVTHKLGGMATIVKDGENGKLFNLGTSPELFANYIENMFHDKEKYSSLAINSRKRYDEYLNWDVAGHSYMRLLC